MCMACRTNGELGTCVGYWWESQEGSDHLGDQDVGGCTVFK
jgi:hypothetical protein